MLMASKCRSFFVILIHPPKISPSAIFGVKINISPILLSGKHGSTLVLTPIAERSDG